MVGKFIEFHPLDCPVRDKRQAYNHPFYRPLVPDGTIKKTNYLRMK